MFSCCLRLQACCFSTQYMVFARFMKRHSYTYRMGTHESQSLLEEVAGKACVWMDHTHPLATRPHHDMRYVFNMDQTPVFFFSMNSKKTLELICRKKIHVRKSTSNTKCATVAVTITTLGHTLTPVVIFKGAENGRIEKKEFLTYPTNMLYQMQENEWMDKRVMHFWVERVLKPYIKTAPEHVIPIIFLDSYRCHIIGSVVNAIRSLGCEVQHIPGGCTGLCQPVDVGYNKPFKSRVCASWVRWMISDGILHSTTSPLSRQEVARWASLAVNNLKGSGIIKHAWRKSGYSWFPIGDGVQRGRSLRLQRLMLRQGTMASMATLAIKLSTNIQIHWGNNNNNK